MWASSGRQWKSEEPGMLQSTGSQSQTWVTDWTTTTIILWHYEKKKKILSNDHEILIVPPNSGYCFQTIERIRKPRLFFLNYLYFHKRHNLKSRVHLKAFRSHQQTQAIVWKKSEGTQGCQWLEQFRETSTRDIPIFLWVTMTLDKTCSATKYLGLNSKMAPGWEGGRYCMLLLKRLIHM